MDNDNKQDPSTKGNWQTIAMLVVAVILTFIVASSINNYLNFRKHQELSYNEFVQMVEAGKVDSIKVGSTEITAIPKKGDTKYSQNLGYYVVRLEGDYDFVNRILDNNVVANHKKSDNSTLLLILLNYTVPFLLPLFLMNFTMKRMGSDGTVGVGKSDAKICVQKETDITFKDMAGEDEAKESPTEIVNFLHNPGKYIKVNAKLPEDALLAGPPGTGKALLAKAVAGEAHVPFYSLSGSDFVETFVNVGAPRIRGLFKNATENTPCIIFIDEIDAIGRGRGSRMGGSDEREQTLNQLLSGVDRFDLTKGLLVLGATSRPGILGPAPLRPGRLDHHVMVDKPNLSGHINILEVHSKDVLLDESVDFKEITLATLGAMNADLTNMMSEAAIDMVKHGHNVVSREDLFETMEVALVDKEKKDHIMSKEERRIVSYHEVGHALVNTLQKHSEPVQKITIVPGIMDALGYVINVPEEEKYLNTREELEARLIELMAGRAIEEIVFETVIMGTANDIQQATNLARTMVTQYDMSDKFGLMGLESRENQYLTGRAVLNCGDATTVKIDQKVMKTLENSYDEAIRLLGDNKDAMDQIAAFLIDKETITGKESVKISHKVRGIPGPGEPKEDDDKGAVPQKLHTNPETQTDRGKRENQAGQANPQEQINPGEQANPQEQVDPEEQANPQTQSNPESQSGPEISDRGNKLEKKIEDTVRSHPGNDRNLQH